MSEYYDERRKEYIIKHDKATYKRVVFRVRLSQVDTFEAHATASAGSVQAYIKQALNAQLERDGASLRLD